MLLSRYFTIISIRAQPFGDWPMRQSMTRVTSPKFRDPGHGLLAYAMNQRASPQYHAHIAHTMKVSRPEGGPMRNRGGSAQMYFAVPSNDMVKESMTERSTRR